MRNQREYGTSGKLKRKKWRKGRNGKQAGMKSYGN
jgi:hypothetical protein